MFVIGSIVIDFIFCYGYFVIDVMFVIDVVCVFTGCSVHRNGGVGENGEPNRYDAERYSQSPATLQ